MLTRIEINGFKSFENFKLDLGPFTVILGPNTAGKSNLFDAIQLMSKIVTSNNLRDAMKGLRGEPHELFRRGADGEPGKTMEFGAEILLDSKARDPYGDEVAIYQTRIKYHIKIESRNDERGIERFYVTEESAQKINKTEDPWQMDKNISKGFRRQFMKYGDRRNEFLKTETNDGKKEFVIYHDGHQGHPRHLPAEAAEASVISSITSSAFPHLYALREEIASWRFLQIEPVDLRKSSSTMANDSLESSGANLPTVLARIQNETKTQTQPQGALTDISADLAHIIPGIQGVAVEEDERNREYYVSIALREGPPFSARVVSDGTLRILALLTLLHDPRQKGLITFEEPENGIHPQRLRDVVKLFRELVTSLHEDEYEPGEPLRQLIINSHSPVVLSCLEDEVVFMDLVTVIDPATKTKTQRSRARKFIIQNELIPNEQTISAIEIERYLDTAKKED